MNLKRNLWWAQHKTDVYKYSTIFLLILIVTISIIYFTYSKFTSSNEATAYETTVESFIKNDYFIASYIDGEWSNEIPGKDDGYAVEKIVCDNGATATWDIKEWGINIRNATQKIKCSVYFKPKVIYDQIAEFAANDSTSFATDDPDSNIRYIGKNPNNYVYFNCSDYTNQSDSTCEKWRIIGAFNNALKADNTTENLVKIIKEDSIGILSTGDPYTYTMSDSAILKLLNSSYYSGTYKTDALKNDATRNLVENIKWIGARLGYTDSFSEIYSREYHGYAGYDAKIGLINLTDYGLASSGSASTSRSSCFPNNGMYSSFSSDCTNNNYLYKDSYSQWIITAGAVSESSFELFISDSGNLDQASNSDDNGTRPTLYLKSNVIISAGDGTSTSPYQISSTITFNVDLHGNEYTMTADNGMTWEKFINSSYNNGSFEIIDGTVLYSSFKNTDGSVSPSSLIKNGETYSFDERYGG